MTIDSIHFICSWKEKFLYIVICVVLCYYSFPDMDPYTYQNTDLRRYVEFNIKNKYYTFLFFSLIFIYLFCFPIVEQNAQLKFTICTTVEVFINGNEFLVVVDQKKKINSGFLFTFKHIQNYISM